MMHCTRNVPKGKERLCLSAKFLESLATAQDKEEFLESVKGAGDGTYWGAVRKMAAGAGVVATALAAPLAGAIALVAFGAWMLHEVEIRKSGAERYVGHEAFCAKCGKGKKDQGCPLIGDVRSELKLQADEASMEWALSLFDTTD